MFNRSPKGRLHKVKKGKNYDDNSNDFRSGSNHDCQGCNSQQQIGDGQITQPSNVGKKMRAVTPTVLTNKKKG